MFFISVFHDTAGVPDAFDVDVKILHTVLQKLVGMLLYINQAFALSNSSTLMASNGSTSGAGLSAWGSDGLDAAGC